MTELKKSAIIFFFLFELGIPLSVFFSSCTPPVKADCPGNYKSAQSHFSSYYRHRDSTELMLALSAVNAAPACAEYRKKFVSLKMSILFMMGRYNDLAVFMDSCQADDFAKSYQKPYSKNFALAKAYEGKKDIPRRDAMLKQNVALLADYIQKSKGPAIDSAAHFDFFLMESMLLPKDRFMPLIDSARKEHPADSLFFSGMTRTLYQE